MHNGLKTALLGCALMWGAEARAGTVLEPHLQLSAEERYDDDALVRTGGAGQLMTKLSPRIALDVKDPLFTSNAWYAADFLMRHGSGKSTFDHRFGLTAQKGFSRRVFLHAEAEAWRVSDPSSLPRMGVARTIDPVLYGTGQLYGGARLTERLEGRLGYRFEGAKVFDALDSAPGFSHAPFAGLGYDLSRRLNVGAEYRYQLFQLGPEIAQAHGVVGTFRYRMSRQWALDGNAGAARFEGAERDGYVPRVTLQLMRDGQQLDVAFAAGHDLVGASGFSSALWADYGSFTFEYRLNRPLRFFGAASLFRNGRAPDLGWSFDVDVARVATGYAAGAGLEWEFNRTFSMQATFNRYAQVVGDDGAATADLARNIAAVRLVVTAF